MVRVKDMGRRQQKAVFANLGKGSSVSNMSARREKLLSNDLATESQQDKIDRIMRNNRLTHRQKMDRIARLKGGGSSGRISSSDVPAGTRDTNVESPGLRLIYQKTLNQAEKRRLLRKDYKVKQPGAEFFPTKKPGVYILTENGKTYTWKDGKKTNLRPSKYHVKPGSAKLLIAPSRNNPKKPKITTEYRVHSQGSISGHYVIAKNEEHAKDLVAKQHGYLNRGLLVAKPWKYWRGGTATRADTAGGAALRKRLAKHSPVTTLKKGKTVYFVKFVDKNTKIRGFREVTAKNRKDARKILLKEKKNVGIVSISKKTPRAYLLEKKLKKKDMNYRQLKASGVTLKPNADHDKDGVKNSKDCRPMNKKKQYASPYDPYTVGYSRKSYKQLKKEGVRLKPDGDYDGDGVKNSKDCRPMNKKKQDLWSEAASLGYGAAKAGAKAGGKYAKKVAYARSSEGRIEKAKAKIRKIEAKRRAETFNRDQKARAKRLELEAKQREAEYKRQHPKKFGIF